MRSIKGDATEIRKMKNSTAVGITCVVLSRPSQPRLINSNTPRPLRSGTCL
jgi:hypothetical protein